ncbi:MAG: LytR/AlgR family response regulator transcription factor [Bacteroidota bacterium]
MKTVIIEDERLAADNLTQLLQEIDGRIEVVAVLDSVKRATEWLATNNPDLIFLDIHLADDISFKIFEAVEVKAPIIFVTAYDSYAIQAFKLNSIDYLLKPIDKEELKQAIKKYNSLGALSTEAVMQLLQQIKTPAPEYQKRFMVTTGQKIKSVEVDDAAYFYAEDRFVYMVSKAGEKYIIDFTLDKLEGLLNPAHFFRINRGQLVAFTAIKNMYSYTKSRIKIEVNPPAPFDTIVSIDRSGAFKKWLNR